MSVIQGYNFNRSYGYDSQIPFRTGEPSKIPILTKPIDKVESIANSVDEFVSTTNDEEKKKSHKKMIRVGSIVLVLSAIGLILNPKFSSSLVNKLKTKSTKAANNAKVDDSIWGKWNKIKEKFLTGLTNTIQVLNNINSTKDELFQKLCNKTSITKQMHSGITNVFDKISKNTVLFKYGKVKKKSDKLYEIINHYKDRLSDSERKILEDKLKEIDKRQEYFSESKTKGRLLKQEKCMSNLENEVWTKIKGYFDKDLLKGKHVKDVYKFWAEDALMPQRTQLEAEGKQVVDSLTGDGKTQKGAYREIIDLLGAKLTQEEKSALEDTVNKTDKLLRSANKSECIEYFDKKRDFMLGSAPTDVATAVLSLIASAVAIGTADSKEDKISRTITGALPVIAGLGVSTALTAMLFSGGKGMALGTGSGMLLSAMGSMANRAIFPKDKSTDPAFAKKSQKQDAEPKEQKSLSQEINVT